MSLAFHIFLLSLLSIAALAQLSPIDEYPIPGPEDSISILYSGTISGTYRASGSNKSCPTYKLGPLRKSYFTIGVNPPWDPNPFFFQIDHQATEYTGAGITYTSDEIWSLWNLSADRVLNVFLPGGWEPGDRCSDCSPSNKTVAQVWDLKSAQIGMGNANGEPSYNITGDASTFLGIGALRSSDVLITPLVGYQDFDAQQALGCIAPDPSAVTLETTMRFNWEPSSKPTYSIAVSNSTANVSMTLNTTSGFLTLRFTGKRLDYAFRFGEGNFGNVTLQLDTSNPALPSFTYTNGSKFSWIPKYAMNYSNGPWQPLAEGVSRGPNTTKKNDAPIVGTWTAWAWSWWILGLVGIGAFM